MYGDIIDESGKGSCEFLWSVQDLFQLRRHSWVVKADVLLKSPKKADQVDNTEP